MGGIINQEGYQIKDGNTIPLISNLEISSIFKDKAKEEEDGITDLITAVV